MQWIPSVIRTAAAPCLLLMAGSLQAGSACLDVVFDNDFENPVFERYEVAVVIDQLGSRSASFQLNDGEVVTASSDGGFCFSEPIPGGDPYLISVTAQPETGLACAADEPIGIASGPIRILVTCDLTRTDWNEFSWDDTHWN